MGSVDLDLVLRSDQLKDPVIWTQSMPEQFRSLLGRIDTSDAAMAPFIPDGKGMALKSFGHSGQGVHFLLTRAGTTVHTDPAYTRYSHQLVLRNDGNRIRGLPRYDSEDPTRWHQPFLPGVMYALDTHSPHQGLGDIRIAPKPGLKAVLAVDRDDVLSPEEVWQLLRPWLQAAVQFTDVAHSDQVLGKTTAPRWKASAR
jgi:hypothetical protein